MTWMDDARCAGDSRFHAENDYALLVCNGDPVIEEPPCPVRGECWLWASKEGGFDGVAGGQVWRQRGYSQEWTPADMRTAHAQWYSGLRTAWIEEGHRAFEAWRKREQRAAKKAAA